MIQKMDTDENGRVSKPEMDVWIQKVQDNGYRKESLVMFRKEDRNNDGVITFSEYWMNERGDGEWVWLYEE